MNNAPQKSDLQILFEELNQLLARAKTANTPSEKAEIELEIEALKIKRELVQLHQEALEKHNILKFQKQIAWWEERGRNFRAKNDANIKLTSEAIGFAKIAINTLVILNAGAVLAVLAFLGNTLKEECVVKDINFLEYFIWAALLAVTAAGLGYISQILFIELSKSKRNLWGNRVRYAAVATALASLLLFGMGAYSALKTFRDGNVYECYHEQAVKAQALPLMHSP